MIGRLMVDYMEANTRHFAGLLPTVPIDVATIRRPRGKVGMIACTQTSWADNKPLCILFDVDFAMKEPSWPAIVHVLLHEMIHVWQAVRGERPNHGSSFRTMAKRLGISERAVD